MARIIWNRRENPSEYVSGQLGITRAQLGDAIHEIKAAGDLSPADRVIIYDDGTVTDERGDVLGTSTMKSENRSRAFATLRLAGDALDPDEISRVIKEQPTRAYRKGQKYRTGPHGPEIVGKTGVWYFSTRRKIPSRDLIDHLEALVRLVSPFADDGKRLSQLQIGRAHV